MLGMVLLSTWARWGRLGRLLGGALLLLAATTMLWPERWLVGQVTVAWVPHSILVLGAMLAPGQSMPRRVLWVWFGAPWLFYLFVTAWPLTHIHVSFPAWSVLVALGVMDAVDWLARRPRTKRWMLAVPAVAFYVVCGYYPIMMFVDHTPEYRQTFPEFKRALYWTPYEQIPEHGLFGFPYRAGWKVVGHLRDAGILGGDYDSNEESAIANYYTRDAPRWECPTPDVYIAAMNVQDEEPLRWWQIDADYRPSIRVTVGGEEKLVVHQRTLTSASGIYAVEDYARLFDQTTTPERMAIVAPAAEMAIPAQLVEQDLTLGGIVRLTGYQLSSDHAIPGGYVDIVLRWEAWRSTPAD